MKSQLVSASSTLMLKYLLPILFSSFFGCFTAFVLFVFPASWFQGAPLPVWVIKLLVLGFWLSSMLLFYAICKPLRRVEMDLDYMYVSDYFKTYRYTYESIDRLEERNYLLFKVMQVEFYEAGSMGKQFSFVVGYRFAPLLQKFPEIAQRLIRKA